MTSMSRARVARRIAAGAAYGGGGIGLAGAAAVGLLLAEARLARRHVNGNGEQVRVPRAEGRYGRTYDAPGTPGADPLRLALLGDSTAAGQGVRRSGQTPGALLASGLAAVAERPVELRNVALPGAQSDDLDRQVALVVGDPGGRVPDICVIMIGANDVTHRMPPTRSVRHLSAAVRRLRTAGAEVVVGTCPDLGTIEPVPQPLRWLARRASRQLAAAQTIGVVEQGGRTVSLGDLLGPEFEANPRELFGPDHYHPSAEGYATAAMAVLPTLCAALGLWPAEEERPDAARREGFLPVARAAAEAASEAGTEVAAAMPTGPRGPWALLKRRRRRRVSEAEPAPASPTSPSGV
ncbi:MULTISPECIES: SGNH/GDSL hydrolase family protein [Streptomyces]|uniref:SGNH/GDSL hydrolase family protein n=1 Tax=Streptomyces TaxID=1883 RepID=UPI001587371D|nr:SGNH/GDSL hydrolase family protein [Streptomyces sp. CAI-85]MBO7937116.1 SGNH/GDSL hydrolase family protein [Streptomyces sp. S9]NUV59166.1 SGNH/GDSL hydrolase family protein [Streptomyces sp. CAI-85]